MYLQLKSASHERHCLIVMSEVFFSFYLDETHAPDINTKRTSFRMHRLIDSRKHIWEISLVFCVQEPCFLSTCCNFAGDTYVRSEVEGTKTFWSMDLFSWPVHRQVWHKPRRSAGATWQRATHWDAALQHLQAPQFKQKLAKFCNIPRSECPSCPARRAATFDASCLHLLCVGPKRRRDDNLHRHVSPTSGRVCFSSRVENLHRPFLRFLCLGAAWPSFG